MTGRFVSVVLMLACIVMMLAGGGCEAIITADPPGGWSCDGTFDASVCPEGQRCLSSKCVPCISGNCAVSACETTDKDGDGYFLCGHPNDAGTALIDADCDDSDPKVHPYAAQVCNGRDNDCDRFADDPCPEGFTCAGKQGQCIDKAIACTAGNCPAGLVCDLGTRQCIALQSKKLGQACNADLECESGAFCGYSTHLTTSIVRAPEDGGAPPAGICTRPCCTSFDCPSDFVCFGAGTGGNYCASKGAMGRKDIGPKKGGEACPTGRNDECRSGVCNANKVCEDTCCNSGQCGGGATCKVVTLQGVSNGTSTTTTTVLGCGTPDENAASIGARCEAPRVLQPPYPTCKEGICDNDGSTCRSSCCSSDGCTTTCDKVPAYNKTDIKVTACTASGPKGATPLGGLCTNDTECVGGHCFQGDASNPTKYCSDACCIDSDCHPETTGLVCRPYDTTTHYLRCLRPPPTPAVRSAPVP